MHLYHRTDKLLCPANVARSILTKRGFDPDAFKSWDACMDNIVCKAIAIAGIVLGALIILWVFVAIVRCCFAGISTLSACCFCCCSDRHHSMDPPLLQNNSPSNRNRDSYMPGFQPQYHSASSGFGGSHRRSISPPPPMDLGARSATPVSHTGKTASPPPSYKGSNDYSWGYVGDRGDRRPGATGGLKQPLDNTESMEMEPYNPEYPYADPKMNNSQTAFLNHQQYEYGPPQGPPPGHVAHHPPPPARAGSPFVAMPPSAGVGGGAPVYQPPQPQPQQPYQQPHSPTYDRYENYASYEPQPSPPLQPHPQYQPPPRNRPPHF